MIRQTLLELVDRGGVHLLDVQVAEARLDLTPALPLRWRATGRAYDFVVIGFGVWFLVARGGWLPWTCFVVANLASLWLFDNKLFSHEIPLTRPWFAPLTFLVIGSLTLWPFILTIENDAARVRGMAGLLVFLGIRLLFPITTNNPTQIEPRGKDLKRQIDRKEDLTGRDGE